MPAERRPARSPHEAVDSFRRALCLALSCVTNVVPQLDPYSPAKDLHLATLNGADPIFLETATGQSVGLIVNMQYRVVEDRSSGGWFVRTAAYVYALTDEQGRELFAYHWHPEWRGEVDYTHLQLQYRLLRRPWQLFEDKHMPTARIAVEDVLWMLLKELAVTPNRQDWQDVLEDTRRAFEAARTWSGRRRPRVE